ncbi:MAG TPA: ISKra4 family transposase [Streptosporangiaceae bacterium]
MSEYAPGAEKAFAQARAWYEETEAWLAGEGAAVLTHAELEGHLQARGRELLRRLFQDHLDLRAAREQRRTDVAGPDGVPRTRTETGHARPLATVFGPVTVIRMAYRAAGVPNVHPADAQLNLPEEKHSHGLRRLTAVESARGSHQDATAAITRATGVAIGKRQVEELTRRAAADIDRFYADRRPGPCDDDVTLVLQADGKGIVMLPGALRPATAKAAAAGKNKLATRLSPGEKRGRKRMAEIAAVYDCTPVPRTPGDIITPPGAGTKEKRKPGPKAAGKWLTASVTDDIAAVIGDAFDEAERRDPQHKRTWAALVDGNNAQIDAMTAEAATRGVTVTILIDFVHVLEYLWKAAWSFFEPGDPDAETWVADRAARILQGKATAVAAGIRRRASTYSYQGKEREGADTCAAYLTAKAPHLDYATALAKGWPIATGVIEGACRHLVADRMAITGARWGLQGAEAVLKLRAVLANSDFDQYWAYHLRREHERIHHVRYRETLVLAA